MGSEYGGSVAARAVMFCNTEMTPNLGMRKLTKPEYYAATRTEKNRQYAIQSVFHAQPGNELCTSTIPLLARIRPDNIGISKMATITEIGTFPGIKQFTIRQTKTIDQNDVFNESDEEFEKDEPENIADVCLENEEEIVIEDFDD